MNEDKSRKEMFMDNDIKIAHRNVLWLLYRLLAEKLLTDEQLEDIINKFYSIR